MLWHDLQPTVAQMWRFLLPFIDDTQHLLSIIYKNFFTNDQIYFCALTQTNSLS